LLDNVHACGVYTDACRQPKGYIQYIGRFCAGKANFPVGGGYPGRYPVTKPQVFVTRQALCFMLLNYFYIKFMQVYSYLAIDSQTCMGLVPD